MKRLSFTKIRYNRKNSINKEKKEKEGTDSNSIYNNDSIFILIVYFVLCCILLYLLYRV